jgi:hypothetical protein
MDISSRSQSSTSSLDGENPISPSDIILQGNPQVFIELLELKKYEDGYQVNSDDKTQDLHWFLGRTWTRRRTCIFCFLFFIFL